MMDALGRLLAGDVIEMVDGDQGRLGRIVRQFRRRAGLTQHEAAELAGLSVGALRDIEQGRVSRPRVSTLRRLGSVLGLSRAELADLVREAGEGGRGGNGLRVEVLGPLRVTVNGEVVNPGSENQRVLLALLALSPNQPVMRDTLAEAVWGGRQADRGAAPLQSHMSRLRRRLQASAPDSGLPQALVALRGGYQLVVAEDQHDLLLFRDLVARARRAREDGELADARRLFAEAVALWRGDPLAGLPVLRSHPAVVALVEDYRTAVVAYAEVCCDLGRYPEVLPLLRQVADADPLHESVHARLMVALAGSGQQAAALKVFDVLRRRLAEELGADPGPELAEAHQRVLRHEVSRREVAPVTAHRQLPPDIADFSGREAQLRELFASVPVPDGGTAVPICLIEGMAGVGKTQFAVHAAHRLLAAGRFGETQLYADLRGHSDQAPADPSAVLASFLRLLGVPGDQIPPSLDERACLYRDRLYGKDVLVLLDNAAGEDQVMPLLPAGPTNLALITSRRALALDGARTLSLDVFTPAEARELLARTVGERRMSDQPEAVARVVELCGRLPLAVALAGRRLQSHSGWTVADLAARLAGAGDRLGELAAGGRRLRAVFDLSYQALDSEERRMFRLLGLHPGDDFGVLSVAALAGLTPERARQLLDRLVDENLLRLVGRGRYQLHDLLARHARVLVRDEEPEEARRAAINRVLDFYLHTTAGAAHLLRPDRRWRELAAAKPAHQPAWSEPAEARRWLDAERACLIAAGGIAAEQGWPAHAWQLTWSLREYLLRYGHCRHEDWLRIHEATLAATLAAGDVLGAAVTREDLARIYLRHGRTAEARDHLEQALAAHREAGHRLFETDTLQTLVVACSRLGDFGEAARHAERAVALCAGRDPYREGELRVEFGEVLVALGRWDEALISFRRGLVLSRQAGNPDSECHALAGIGDLHRRLGRPAEALASLQEGLSVAAANGQLTREAHLRLRLGATYRDLGLFDDALTNLREARRIVCTRGGPVMESEALIELGMAHRDIGSLAVAYDLLEQGLRLAVSRGERYQEARSLRELAELHRCAARAELACSHWRRAHALFAELGTPEAEGIRQLLDAVA